VSASELSHLPVPAISNPPSELSQQWLSRGLTDYARTLAVEDSPKEECMSRGDAGGTGRFVSHGPVEMPRLLWSVDVASHHAVNIAIGGTRLFVPTSGQLVCFDLFSGKQLWKFPNDHFDALLWPMTSVILKNGLVIVRGDHSLIGLDQATGLVVWEHRELNYHTWISDHVAHGNSLYVVDGSNLICLEVNTGNPSWQVDLANLDSTLRPHQGSTICAAENGQLFGATGDKTWSFSLQSKTLLWTHPIATGNAISGIGIGMHEVFFSSNGGMFSSDLLTGLERWNTKSGTVTPPTVSRNFLGACTTNSMLLLWKLPGLMLLHPDEFEYDEDTIPSYRYMNRDSLYPDESLGTSDEDYDRLLEMVDSRDWISPPLPTENGVYLASKSGTVHFLDSSAKQRWQFNIDGYATAPILVANGVIVVPLNTSGFSRGIDQIAVLGNM
jgi:outer membrane protein assembly factor BamB